MKYCLSNDTWDEKEMIAAKRIIDSRYYTMGNTVKEFEKQFAQYFGCKYAVMSNSGSSANLLTVAALIYSGKLKCGDEVIVTAVSWSTTYFPLAQFGLKIRFVDIDKHTLNIDIEKMEKAITNETKAVFAVNLLGNPNDYDRIQKICNRYGLLLLEDNCESMGATYNGQKAGSFGLISSFSTFYSHHICTMEGGLNLTNDEELYHYMLAIRSHGWTRHLPDNSVLHIKNSDNFYESFNFIVPGFNVRPLEIEAAVGLEQLKKLDDLIIQRRKNAEYFIESIKNSTDMLIQKEVGESSWFGFALVLPKRVQGERAKYIRALTERGIEVRPIVAGNFTRQRALDYLNYSIYDTLKNADYIHDNGFFVGNHSTEMKENIDLLIDSLVSVE